MRGKIIRSIALILTLVMLSSILASCKESSDDAYSAPEHEFIDNLQSDLTFPGKTFRILGREDNEYLENAHEITADEMSVEAVDQAVYMRNFRISERFGCEIEPILIPGQWNAKDQFIQYFKQSVLSGSGSFDIIVSQQAYMAELGLSEYYINLYDDDIQKYVDLDREYYYQDIKNEITINDKLFFIVGDYTVTYLESLYVLLFNKIICANYGIPDLYQTVRDGEWTIDRLIEYAETVFEDRNGDGGKSKEDLFGFVSDYQNTADALYSQFDCQLTSKDENGNVTFTIDVDKVSSVLKKMIDFYDLENVYTQKTSSNMEIGECVIDIIFSEGRALFYPERLSYAEYFRGMETSFGILPFPKWTATQKEYYTQANNGYSVIVIPSDAPDKSFSAAMIEALSAESCNTVIPEYYDVALKSKYARDNESGEMIDIARDGARINFGYFYAVPLGTATQVFRELIYNKITEFDIFWEANSPSYTLKLNRVIDQYYT